MSTVTRRRVLSVLAILVAAVLWWTSQAGGPDQAAGPSQDDGSSQSSGQDSGAVDPVSGLTWVAVADLPPEAADTLDRIDAGGPFPHPDRDGSTFGNREGLLPQQRTGYYREYTVPTPGSPDRGARRIVTGPAEEYYWTADHYASFERIDR